MATDRQTPCLYYVCAGLCTKGRKADHAHYCQHCNKYRPRVRVRYKNQKKEKLEKICKNEEYSCMKEWKVKALSEAIESNNKLRINIALDNFTTMELLVLLFRKVFKKKKLEKIQKNERY